MTRTIDTDRVIDELLAGIDAGGATVSPWAADFAPPFGYMVSVAEYEHTFDASDADQAGRSPAEHVARYVASKVAELGDSESAAWYFGVWVDGGRAYLDISEWFADLDDAMHAGRVNRQIAIYDILAGAALPVEG